MSLGTVVFKFAILASTLAVSQWLGAVHQLTLTKRQLCDIELLMNGAFAPLKGFMTQADYDGVVNNMHLADGKLWPIPIVLDVSEDEAIKISKDKDQILELKSPEEYVLARMRVQDMYVPDKHREALKVYGTDSLEHPGVDYLMKQTKPVYVGGEITPVSAPRHYDFADLRKSPAELKQYFKDNHISRVVAFQTRNPMHRAHLELTFRAAKQANAHLLIHPVVGLTKPGDVDHFTRVRCYKKLIPHYPEGTATLAVLPLSMRMAGPREAVWHALIRKNYGATHFIVGRDHAGPGKDSKGVPFYGPYEAQELVKKHAQEIGIEVMPFSEMVYVPETDSYEPVDQIPSTTKTLSISGTQLRDILRTGADIPSWFTYPEIAQELRVAYPPRNKQGFVVFFTGLSGSGKSTLAMALANKLHELQDRPISILDGDIVRKNLSSELGFSRAHRSVNIQRIGYVASEVSKNGGVAICAPIAPYEEDRKINRALISERAGYIEVFVSTSLEACEARDTKGLYAKARAGIVKEFTGISDPYEAPTNAELVLDAGLLTVDQCLDQIISYLRKEGFIS